MREDCHCFQVWQNYFSRDTHSKNCVQDRFIYLLYFQGFIKVVLKQQLILLLSFLHFLFMIFLMDTEC